MESYYQDFRAQVPGSSPSSAHKPPSVLSVVFIGPTGLRAGWRLLIFFGVLISCLLGFREVILHTPILIRTIEPLREGRLVVSAALIAEIQLVFSLLIALCVMGRIEKRALGDYGLPGRGFLGSCFWLGVAWGLSAVTCLMLLISAAGGFSFGSLALRGRSLAGYAVAWLSSSSWLGSSKNICSEAIRNLLWLPQ